MSQPATETTPPTASAAVDSGTPAKPLGPGEIFRQLGPAGPLGILWSIAPGVVGTLLLVYLNTVSGWLRALGRPTDVVVYVAVFVVSAGLGLLPTYSQALLGGWCFGFALGFPAALAGFVGASIVGFIVVKTVARDRVEQLVARHRKAQAARDALIGRGFLKTLGIVALLRFPPNSPFAITNLAMTSTGVKFPVFVLGTLIGMAPRTGVVAYLGSTLQGLTAEEAAKTSRPWWYIPASVVLTVVVLGVIGLIANRAIKRVTGGRSAAAPQPERTQRGLAATNANAEDTEVSEKDGGRKRFVGATK